MALKRLNFNMEESLVDRIDVWAKKMSIPRNAAIALMCSQFLDSQNALNSLSYLVDMAKAQQMESSLNLSLPGDMEK